ncbi:MAG: ABC transporter permease [Rhodospirillales bacterium]|nr:MAG: ABC transporter permease [Rhodospirillales bacterium]
MSFREATRADIGPGGLHNDPPHPSRAARGPLPSPPASGRRGRSSAHAVPLPPAPATRHDRGMAQASALARFRDSDLWHSFTRSPLTVTAAIVTVVFVLGAVFAPWLAPHDPFDPKSLNLMDAFTKPIWTAEGREAAQGGKVFPLGTDNQGRDVLSAIMYGCRVSLLVSAAAIGFAVTLGVGLGLTAGFRGGWADNLIMRVADIQLTVPAILIALTLDGVARAALPKDFHDRFAIWVLILAIGFANWPQFARVTRATTLAEKGKDYVSAARIIGIPGVKIALKHVLPNAIGPVLVIATIGLALAIIAEASLSFLGVGMPPTQPSLGTLIRIGNAFLFSGEWWIVIFPALALVVLSLAVNLLGDWLRDALNPKLR